MTVKIRFAVALTGFGLCLFASFFLFRETWAAIDRAVFFFFNVRLVPDSLFLKLAAYTNVRAFDAVSLAAMGGLYLSYFLRQDSAGKRLMICLGLSMLLVGIIIKQLGDCLYISHPSPTLVFENSNRLTELTNISAKDAARNSFPGDHGMMLMIFAAYMARYFGRRAFFAAACFVVIFSMPRIISGAHWFSDIYMGSLAIACVALSWLLLTPASDILAAKLEKFLPSRVFPPGPGV